MTPSLTAMSKRPVRSPISKIPYDVLREIFIHCLPRYPLEIQQPDTTVAPMLLCQICSSWRTAAVKSPTLWSHLYHYLIADIVHEELGELAFLQDEIDFLLWWKKKQGSVPPFLRLDVMIDIMNGAPIVAGDGMAFILKYVSSAQYLDIAPMFWSRIYEKFEIGEQVALPNLHTLVTCGEEEEEGDVIEDCFYDTQFLIGLIPTHTPSALRRLVIDMDSDDPCHNTPIPAHWSTLTHLAMRTNDFPLNFWFSLTRGLPDLQWVYIEFEELTGTEECAKPTKCTLSQLSTLYIRARYGFHDSEESPFSPLLTDLHLPVLRSLSLSSEGHLWQDHRAITELYTVLRSTPTLRKLVIEGADFLGLDDRKYRTEVHTAIGETEPIWSYVPDLVHLRLKLPSTRRYRDKDAAMMLDTFIRNVFFSQTRWLDLDNSACPIRRITLSNLDILPSNPLLERIKKFTMSMARKYIKRSNITFKIISEAGAENFEPWTKWLR